MTIHAHHQPKTTADVHAPTWLLQRRCACGGASGLDGKCAACRKKRLRGQAALSLQPKLAINQPGDAFEREADRVAEQVTQPLVTSGSGSVSHLTAWPRPQVQREAASPTGSMSAPPIVHETLNSPGQPLDSASRAFFEPRFGHDFSRVRVHTDSRAAESARAVNALAYTVGREVVFGPGQYRPNTDSGRKLLAHELTHVVQQARGRPTGLQRQEPARPRPAPVDADAQRIIDLAQDSSRPIDERAVAVVQAIIDQYFSGDRAKISRITYRADESGLHITYGGRGASTTGILEVGRYFVENTTQRHFARRVLQVRHEIEHVEQQRAGMGGESRQDEREFIAFYHEALATELPGTGRLQHSTRVQLIDGALGYYFCLSADLQRDNTTRRDELHTRRTEAVRQSGRSDLGSAPTACRRQGH